MARREGDTVNETWVYLVWMRTDRGVAARLCGIYEDEVNAVDEANEWRDSFGRLEDELGNEGTWDVWVQKRLVSKMR